MIAGEQQHMAKILVVDDEPDILRFVEKILEARGHSVVTAADGAKGLELAGSERPDVIVLDLNLPHMDGHEVCRKLKGDDATRHIPIVLMTAAFVSVDDADHGTGLGADEYVVKPFLREVLIHNVERLIPQPS